MRAFTIFITILVLSVVVLSSPIDTNNQLTNTPTSHYVQRRSAPAKGTKPGVKGYNPTPPPSIRKGEYVCGNRICKLKPGQVPKGCNGICQYAVGP